MNTKEQYGLAYRYARLCWLNGITLAKYHNFMLSLGISNQASMGAWRSMMKVGYYDDIGENYRTIVIARARRTGNIALSKL